MEKIKRLYLGHERPFLLVLAAALWGLMYYAVDSLPRLVPATFLPWDPVWHLPFMSAFVIPYLSLYVMPLVALIAPDNRPLFRRITATVLVAMVISSAVFVLLPLELPRTVPDGQGMFGDLVAAIYANDANGNFFPSQHVILAFLLAFGVGRLQPRWRLPMLGWAVLISVSTVLIRQHYVVDVFGGLLAALTAWHGLRIYERLRIS